MKKADVIEFLKLHAEAALAEKRLKELREILLPALQGGEESPADLPYLLVASSQDRVVKDWRSPLYRLLKRTLGKVRADKRIEQIEAQFGSIAVEQLLVKPNHKFALQVGEKSAA